MREAILSGFAADFNPAGQALLFAAARVDHLDKTIVPALARGAWVVSDRFANSTRAYQGAARNAAGVHRLSGAPDRWPGRPDLTLILDLSPEIGLKGQPAKADGTGRPVRIGGTHLSPDLATGVPLHRRRRAGRCVVIDAARSEADVAAAIWSAVESRLDPAGALKAKCA